MSLDALIVPNDPTSLAVSTGQAYGYGAEHGGGLSVPPSASAELTGSIPKAGGGGGVRLKLLPLIRVDQQGASSTSNGPFSLIFCL